ncbi:MAG: ribbon-helix-helix domain-containing protein [Acidobacteriota bacterium]
MATKTLNISLPEELIKEIDASIKKRYSSRSEYFRNLALDDLDRKRRWDAIFAEGKKIGKKAGITSEQQVYDMLYQDKQERRAKREALQNRQKKTRSH